MINKKSFYFKINLGDMKFKLIKNYKTLEEKYIQLKKEKENNKTIKTFYN